MKTKLKVVLVRKTRGKQSNPVDREAKRRDETRCFAMRGVTRCYHDQIPGEDYCGGHTGDSERFNLNAHRKALKKHNPLVFALQPPKRRRVVLG